VNLAADTPLLRAGIVTTGAQALSTSSGTCPVADLSGGFEAYLRRLSSHGRKRARSLLREGARAGVRLEIADVHECQAAFDDLMRLHQARWRLEAKPGVFAAPRFVEFHRRLIGEWHGGRRALVARMLLGNTPVAAIYGFVIGSKFDFYQSGVDLRSAASLESPGILAQLLLMQALVDRGLTLYDFLGGAAPYKKRLATGENRLLSVQVRRPTIRTTAYRSAELLGQIFRTGLLRKK